MSIRGRAVVAVVSPLLLYLAAAGAARGHCCCGMKIPLLPVSFPQFTPLYPVAYRVPQPYSVPQYAVPGAQYPNPVAKQPVPVERPKSEPQLPQALEKGPSAADFKSLLTNKESNQLIRTTDEKAQWSRDAFERGLRAEQEGNYLLAKICYYNSLSYPNTPVAAQAQAGAERMENALSRREAAARKQRPLR